MYWWRSRDCHGNPITVIDFNNWIIDSFFCSSKYYLSFEFSTGHEEKLLDCNGCCNEVVRQGCVGRGGAVPATATGTAIATTVRATSTAAAAASGAVRGARGGGLRGVLRRAAALV